MSSTKQKLRLAGALAALTTLALAVSCRGFFVNPTLTAIAISPTAPQVQVGQTTTLAAYGTYNDGSTGQVTSGLSWSSGSPTVATFLNATSGTVSGLSLGTSTITANAQAVTASASLTVYQLITSIAISPTTNSIPVDGGSANFTVSAVVSSNGSPTTINITSSATMTALFSGAIATGINCAYDGVQYQVCTDTQATQGIYQIVASYPPNTQTATANLTVPAP
jgi:Bacterial Ig-like domain (group 2)